MNPQPLATDARPSSARHTPVAGLRLGLRARAFSAQSEPVAACRRLEMDAPLFAQHKEQEYAA